MNDVDVLSKVVLLLDKIKNDEKSIKWVLTSVNNRYGCGTSSVGNKVTSEPSSFTSESSGNEDLETFVTSKGNLKLGQQAAVIAYWIMRKDKKDKILISEIGKKIDQTYGRVPRRLDATIQQATVNGRKLFYKEGKEYGLTSAGHKLATSGKEAIKKSPVKRKKKRVPKTQ